MSIHISFSIQKWSILSLLYVVLLITKRLNGSNVNISTTEATDSHEEEDYSLSGTFTVSNTIDNELFVVKMEINSDCSNIKLNFILSGNNGWFSIGIGGDYNLASSEESHSTSGEYISEAVNMNGYAIVVMSVDDIYESTLQVGAVPTRQPVNNLQCNGVSENGMTRIECTRSYYTNDGLADDFYKFITGINPIIYAWGPIGDDGIAIQHGANSESYGEAHKDFIYMKEGYELCEYANKYAMEQNVNNNGSEDNVWEIVAIVVIAVLVGAVCGVICIILIWKSIQFKQKDTTKRKGNYVATDTDMDTDMRVD